MPVLTSGADANSDLRAVANQFAAAALGPRDIGFVQTLRISVTDHCNLRCVYCMPEDGVDWLPRENLLTFEEIVEVARAAIDLGVRNFKITGGEPLVRRDVVSLIEMLRRLPGVEEISLTTNGMLLTPLVRTLRDAGVDRVTVSLDTLREDRFRGITRTGDLKIVWRGIEAAEEAGLGPVKLNVVVMRDYNLDELTDFAALTLNTARTVRFIEFMPLGDSKLLTDEARQFVPFDEMRQRIEAKHGSMMPADRDVGHGPARVFQLPGARGRVGFIHAMSAPFCSTCNRLRLTPDGQLRSCLFDGGEVELKPLLRPHTSRTALRRAFVDCVTLKPDQHHRYGNRQMSQIGG